jgi:hypothetical protein
VKEKITLTFNLKPKDWKISIFECTAFQEIKMRPQDIPPQLIAKLLEDFRKSICWGKPIFFYPVIERKKGQGTGASPKWEHISKQAYLSGKQIVGDLKIGFWC